MAAPQRLPKLIAVMSLSRIDAAAINQALLGAFKQKDPVVSYLAWEALQARHGSLSPTQRQAWLRGGLDTALQGGFPGWTAEPLLRALAECHPTILEDEPHRLALGVVRENSLEDKRGRATLDALGDLVAGWHDPAMVRYLVGQMKDGHVAGRIDYVLRGLSGAGRVAGE